MTTGYYPGCSLGGTSREFGESLVAVTNALGAPLTEIEDWSCCGASSAHLVDHRLAVALPARNLALASEQGFDEVVAPCAACYNRLAAARRAIASDASVALEMTEIVGRPATARAEVRNVIELIARLAPVIAPRITRPLTGLRVACYYGCLLVRPAAVTGFDDGEQPASMERLATLCGATPVRWNMAVECCGGSFSVCRTGSVIRLGRAILEDARKAGAQAILVACPMCHSNLDFRQAAMRRAAERPARRAGPAAAGPSPSNPAPASPDPDALPILFVTEMVGLALGLEPRALGLHRHFVGTSAVISARADKAAPDHPSQQGPSPARRQESR